MDITVNRKAKYDYEFVESYSCGIVLLGSEVTSIRNNHVSLNGSFCYIDNGEVWMKNSYVKNPNDKTRRAFYDFDENRPRKLLLNKKEILKLSHAIEAKGFTIVPYKIYTYKGLIKVEIKLCRGKKEYDKRETIKKRDITNEINKKMKSF